MSGLINGLVSSAKSLGAHQTGVQVASRNLANVTNPNYARQQVVLGDRAVVESSMGPVSTGLEALSVKQFRDNLLDGGVNREKSITSLFQSQQSALNRAQASLGEQVDRSLHDASAQAEHVAHVTRDRGLRVLSRTSVENTRARRLRCTSSKQRGRGTRRVKLAAASSD